MTPFLPHPKSLIGMVHVGALPGTPRHSGESVRRIASRAADETAMLIRAGFDGVAIENMHDAPYLARDVGPEITAAMTAVAIAVKQAADASVKPGTPAPILGIQILGGANIAALAVAYATGLDFVRAEGFVFAAVADEGLLERADAGPLLRYRKMIGADGLGVALTGGAPVLPISQRVRILADIKKKHSSHAITSDVDIAETARAAEFFGADGVIVTGVATGRATSLEDLETVRSATPLPLIVGSGATPESLADLFRCADAVIAGSWFKRGGVWSNEPDPARVRTIVDAAQKCRG